MTFSPALPPRPSNAPPAFHLLAKPTGAACNLDCVYCFFLDDNETCGVGLAIEHNGDLYACDHFYDVHFAYYGECPKNRFILTPDGEPGLNYLCVGFIEFFHHASFPVKLMSGLIRRGREAKEVMEILERTFTGVHRLDPCSRAWD